MSWRTWRRTFRRELGLIRHDRNIITVLMLAPAVYAIFLGTIFVHKGETDIPIVVVDNAHTETSRTLIRSLDAHQLLKVTAVLGDFEAARQEILNADAQAIVDIPPDFDGRLKFGQATVLSLYLNTARFLPSNDINKAATEVALTMGAGVRLKYFQSKGYSTDEAVSLVQPLAGDIRPLFNAAESYGDFLLPGLFMLIIQQTLLFGLAMSVARERETKSLASLWETSGGSPLTAVLGKGSPYFLLYAAYTIAVLTALFWSFHLLLLGSMPALGLLVALFLIALIGFSIFVSSFFRQEIHALQFLVFSSMPLFLLSGYSWPVWSMPLPLRLMTQILPGTPLLQAFVRVTQMGAGWRHIAPELLQLAALAIFWIFLAQWRIRRLKKNEP